MTQPTRKESAPSMVAACVCRNCRQVVPVCRPSAGGFFCAVRTRRIVDTLTRWPSFSSSPWTRWYPQPWFSIARRLMTTVISDWQDQADAKISADCSWRRGVFEKHWLAPRRQIN